MKTLLIIPMYNTVLLPDVDYRLSVESISDAEKDRIEADQGKAVFLPLKTEKKRGEMTAEDFYPFGIAVDVTQISEGPLGTVIEARAREKVRVSSIRILTDAAEGDFEPVDEVMDVTFAGEKQLLEGLKNTTTEVASGFR